MKRGTGVGLHVAVLVALTTAAMGAIPANAAPKTALINANTVVGAPSQEQQIAQDQGFVVTVVSDATWASYTAAQFGAYDLLIAGDPNCGPLPPGLISSAPVYGSVVMGEAGGRTLAGNRIVVGTDPVFHDGGDYTSPDARGTIIREGIAFAGTQPGRTGMYFDATCSGSQSAPILDALSAGAGAWTINADPPCGGSVSLIASNPAFSDLTTASLQGWTCSVHESFPTFRDDWSALAVATDTDSHPTCGIDPGTGEEACGEAYILIAGSSIVVSSESISLAPLDSTNPAGTFHTVTANVHNDEGPLPGELVTFSVTGQNAGATGTCSPVSCQTDVNGNVSFTYFGGAGAGDDTIKADFTDDTDSLQSATAQKHWVVEEESVLLTLQKSDSPDPVDEQNPITYTLDVGNAGTAPATGVVLTDNLPAGTTFNQASTTQGSCSNTATTVTCNIGTIAGGGSETVTIIVQAPNVTANQTITNNASVSASNADTVSDSATTNVIVNAGGSTDGEVPPNTTVPLTYTTSTQSNNGQPAVNQTDNAAVFIVIPPGDPEGGSVSLDELPCATAPCTGPSASPQGNAGARAQAAAAPAQVVLGGVVFEVIPPEGYPNNKPFKVTLLYDKTLNAKKGPVFYFKPGVTLSEIKLAHCGQTPPGQGKPCVLKNEKITSGPPLIRGDWKVTVRINSDPRMRR